MKHFITSLFFVLLSFFSVAQSGYQDVVYLKNGNVVWGKIIERVNNKHIKIKAADKEIHYYPMEDIEKITSERLGGDSNRPNDSGVRKGYIGLTLGPSIPLGDFSNDFGGGAKTGLHLSLVNFGYLFSDHIGICASWFGAANPYLQTGVDPWSYGGIMAGPLFSFPASEKLEWDLRPMIGYAVTTAPNDGWSETLQATAFAYSLGTTLRIHVGGKISLLASADYFSTTPVFKEYDAKQKVRSIALGFGAAFRLK